MSIFKSILLGGMLLLSSSVALAQVSRGAFEGSLGKLSGATRS